VNANILRSLMRDAYYQVVDNLGFRVLAVMFLLPALFLLLVGFREDGIWVARYWHWDYTEWLRSASPEMRVLSESEVAKQRADLLEQLVLAVLTLADQYGTLFGIAAIAFFVPQMLERGAADVVFSKPVSRLALFLSRYFAGLVFVGLLSSLLVGGMFLGLWITSDYVDFGLLWSIPTLVWGFAIFHAISCAIGVFTRSAIAAILLTIVFMPINCGMHAWYERNSVREMKEQLKVEKGEKPAEREWQGRALDVLVDVYHFTMPKGGDGQRIATSLRKRLEREPPEFADDELGLSVAAAPAGFKRDLRSSLHREGVTWIAPHPAGGGEALWRFKRDSVERVGKRTDYVKQLKKDLGVDGKLATISEVSANRFEWREKRGEEERLRRKWVSQLGDAILTIDYDAEAKWAEAEENEHAARVFAAGWSIRSAASRREEAESYDGLFAWNAPWRFNAVLSVATTLLFIAAVLGLGWWKLSRIDF
jgi:ABC-type transport system involved in multi-copper enzyme maturation permease subunit